MSITKQTKQITLTINKRKAKIELISIQNMVGKIQPKKLLAVSNGL